MDEGWVGPTGSLDMVAKRKTPPTPGRNKVPDCPSRSWSLYWLSYTNSEIYHLRIKLIQAVHTREKYNLASPVFFSSKCKKQITRRDSTSICSCTIASFLSLSCSVSLSTSCPCLADCSECRSLVKLRSFAFCPSCETSQTLVIPFCSILVYVTMLYVLHTL